MTWARLYRTAIAGLTSAMIVMVSSVLAQGPAWVSAGQLAEGRHWQSSLVLPDQTIVIIGGIVGSTRFVDGGAMDGHATSTCERFDPVSEAMLPMPPMNVARAEAAAVLTPRGTIVVFGGIEGSSVISQCTRIVEEYDPATNEWTMIGSLEADLRRHSAIMIDDHRVLVAGGCRTDRETYADSEVFDLSTGTSVRTARLPERMKEGLLARLAGGVLAYVGGRQGGANSPRQSSIFVFDPHTLTWATQPQPDDMPAMLSAASVGDVLIACGGSIAEFPNTLSSGVYKIENGSARRIVQLNEGRTAHSMVPMGEQTILLSGGFREDLTTIASSMLIDIENEVVIVHPEHQISRAMHSLVRLEHPVYGRSFYAITGIVNEGSGPSLTPTIERLSIGSEAILLSQTSVARARPRPVPVYPNPVKDVFTVTAAAGSRIKVVDVNGERVADLVSGSATTTVDIRDLSSGAYMVVVEGETKTVVHRIVKY